MKVKKTPEIRKNQIIAAADLVLFEVGLERFTIDQVAAKAEISKGTIYNYYKNKDQILSELGKRALTLLLQTFSNVAEKETSCIAKIKAICHAHYEYTKQYPFYSHLISYMERPEFGVDIKHYLNINYDVVDYTARIIKKGQEQGEIKKNINPHLVIYIVMSTNIGVVQFIKSKKNMLKNHHAIDSRRMIDTLVDMLIEGISATE